jgi:tetratricopeptide (TPR) repeat protein
VALWIGDWYIGAQTTLWLADQADLLLADAAGVTALQRAGVSHVEECCPWTFNPEIHRPDWDADPAFDIGFLGNPNDDIHARRNQWLARVARLDRRYSVRLASGLWGDDYARFVQRCRLTFNLSVTGDINMRCFEAAACGSPVLIDAAAVKQVSRWFVPGVEIVVYTDDDFEDTVAELLEDEPRRQAIARAAHARVQEHAPTPRLRALIRRLESLAAAGCRPGAPERTSLVTRVAAAMPCPDAASLPGCEQLLEQATGAADPRANVVRAAVYYRFALAHPEQAAQAVAWTNEHLNAARGNAWDDGVATLGLLQLARAIGDDAGARVVAQSVLAGIEDRTLRFDPDLPLMSATNVRPGYRWQDAILSAPDIPAALARLAEGVALETLGDVASLRRAVELAPDEPLPRLKLALALLEAGDTDAALVEVDAALALRPLRPDVWKVHAKVLRAAGLHGAARQWFDDLTRLVARLPDLAAAADEARAVFGDLIGGDRRALPNSLAAAKA